MIILKKCLYSSFAVFILSFLFGGCFPSRINQSSNELVFDPSVKQGKLENGISYFIKENTEPGNRIQLRLAVKAGSCMEDEDQNGVAHFVEHMCFNGTKHFRKSAIFDYFQTIGMQFGPEVNAFTRFENTVYVLEIPADNPETLKSSLIVLQDWAHDVTFDPEEIEKERGVIVEEWRSTTQSADGRIFEMIFSELLKNSRYADHNVIGDMNIIQNITPERIVDFYKKWYRPENMAVIAVGDFKSEEIEKVIIDIMGAIPASDSVTEVPCFSIPENHEKTLTVIRDKELNLLQVEICNMSSNEEPVNTVEKLREKYALSMACEIFRNRLKELTIKSDCSWLGADFSQTTLNNSNTIYFAQFIPKNDMFEEAFKAYLDEYERFINLGITKSEFDSIKQEYLLEIRQKYNSRNIISSSSYADAIASYYFDGKMMIAPKEEIKISNSIINQISPDEIIAAFKKVFDKRGTSMFIYSPENVKIPSENDIEDIWKNYESEVRNVAFENDFGDNILMEKPEKKAEIIDNKIINELGANEYTFENGVKIIIKKINNVKNPILIYAGSKGGLYSLDEQDVPSASIAVDYALFSGFGGKSLTQIQRIASEEGLNVSLEIEKSVEFFKGSASLSNMEKTLQLLCLMISAPNFNEDSWNSIYEKYVTVAENFDTQPQNVFIQKAAQEVYGNNLWYTPMTKDYVSKMNRKTAERIYFDRFCNPADFTFVFVGDFNEKKLVDLCAYYLGNLKTNDNREEMKYIDFPFPKGKKNFIVKKGIDNLGFVFMIFGGELPAADSLDDNYKENKIIEFLASALAIRLREVIREDKSGTYEISCDAYISGLADRSYKCLINFGCEPEREEELSAAVVDIINEFKNGKISDELIAKVRETYLRNYENASSSVDWWLERIKNEIIYQDEPLWVSSYYGIIVDWIKKEAIIEAANKYLDTDNFMTFYLKPER